MELLVLDNNFRAVQVLDKLESLIWTDRFSSYGDFEIYTPANLEIINSIKNGYYLWSEHSEHVMIVEDQKINSDVENGNHLIITGRSLESILDRRIIWSQTTLDGDIQTEIEKIINENIINPSDQNRKMDGFIFETTRDADIPNIQVQAQYSGDNLYDVVKKLCDSVNIGFRITLNEKNQFVFGLYSGKDRSYDQILNPYVVFSPSFENLISSDYYESEKGFKNVVLVAGEGEDPNRKNVTVGDVTLTGLRRREMYADARDVTSNTQSGTLSESQYEDLLKQRGTEELGNNKIIKSFEGQAETTQMYRYGEHFFMGDIVQLENEYGIESKVRVVEFIYSENTNGIENYPTFEVVDGNVPTETEVI